MKQKLLTPLFPLLVLIVTIGITTRDAILTLKTDHLIDKIISSELKNDTFHIRALKTNLLLGIFPITSKIEARINAKTGQILEVKKPWCLKILGEFLVREIVNKT